MVASASSASKLHWPGGKTFAFTIFDDTDRQTLAGVQPVYELLTALGMRTTKSLWVLPGSHPDPSAGITCDDRDYVRWLVRLQDAGFELAFHNATYHTSSRSKTEQALTRFQALFGRLPRAHANHSWNREGIYWGDARLSGARKHAYNLVTGFKAAKKFEGHVESSSLFWGDLCSENLDYVRNFVFDDVNTLRSCPFMPYSDADRPYVKAWFASTAGGTARSFLAALSEGNQDRLEAEGGACVMYTHFADGFVEDGRVNPRFAQLMERLSKKNGWFVPVSTLLDHIVAERGIYSITPQERSWLERRWLVGSLGRRLRSKW